MTQRLSQLCGLCLLGVGLLAAGCDRPAAGAPASLVAVSNSYLESALHDVLEAPVRVVRLTPPGTCPGHFDLRPGQVTALRGCRLLLRFDFETGWDQKLAAIAAEGLRIVPIAVPGGLCEPDSYLAACRQVADALMTAQMLTRQGAAKRLATLATRMEEEATWARHRIAEANLRGAPVVSSRHQVAFCRFLGLEVVATLPGADAASMDEVNQAVRRGTSARAIIANQPEGRRLADAIAARLGVPVVVFDNFPDDSSHHGRFDALVRDNVRRLVAVLSP